MWSWVCVGGGWVRVFWGVLCVLPAHIGWGLGGCGEVRLKLP